MRLTSLFLSLAVCVAASRLVAQSPGSLDTNYVTLAGTDSTPGFVVPLAAGKVMTGGSFTNYGGSGRAGLVRLNADGTVDTGFTIPAPKAVSAPVVFNGTVLFAGATNAGTVLGAVVRPDGRTVFYGQFNRLGTVANTDNIALAEADGSLAPFKPALALVTRASVLNGPGDSVYVGGGWNVVDAAKPVVQRLAADGSNDATFVGPTPSSLGYAAGSISTLLRGPGDTVYMVINSTTQEVVRLTATGALDTTFADGGRAAGSFSTTRFAVTSKGQLVLSGTGLYRGQARASSLTRLTLAGAIDPTFVPPAGITLSGEVGVQADGKVVALDAPSVAGRYNENGSRDTGYVNPGKVPVSLPVVVAIDMAIGPDGSAFVAALFYNAQFQALNGIFRILGDPDTAPSIATQPLAQTNTLGARTRFSVTAQGASPLSYQWFRGTTPIPGATGAELTLPVTTAADDADFRCVVSNSRGSAPSAAVHLTLLEPIPGSVYRETDLPAGPDDEVRDLVFDASGGLLATGRFSQWNNANRAHLARLLPGSADLDPAFSPSPPSTANGSQFQVLPLADGKAFVVGLNGVAYNGKSHDGLVRFNADGSVDTTFNPNGVGGSVTYSPVTDNSSLAAVGADGKVVLSAQTWNGENVVVSFVGSYIRLNENGTRDPSFALRGSSYFTTSTVITGLPDGRYLVAGTTNSVGTRFTGVLRLNTDGTVDRTFQTASPYELGAGVNDILVQPDGRILVAGTFNVRNDLTLGLIRLLPDGRLDPTFNGVPQLSQSPNFNRGDVRRIALQADGRIVALARPLNGTFPTSNLLRFWPSGALDPDFQVATNSNRNSTPILFAIAARSDNALFVGGNFTEFSRFPRKSFVRLNGGPLRPTPPAPTIASQPSRVVAKAGTNVTFTIVPGGDGPFLFQWRRNGGPGSTNFTDIPGATNASLTVDNLRLAPTDSGLFQCGVVNPGGFVYSQAITLLVEPDPASPGQVDPSFAPVIALDRRVQQMAVDPDGSFYAVSGGILVRLFEDGTRDTSFTSPADLFVPGVGGVSVVRRQPDGKILVGGVWKDGSVARLLPDGSYDPSFVRANGFTANSRPSQIELQSDGKILVVLPQGGGLRNPAGKTVNSLARFLPDGTLDDTFRSPDLIAALPGIGTNPGALTGLRVLPDDRLYLGGVFTSVQGVARFGVARLEADGSLDTTFVPPTNGLVTIGFGTMGFYALGPVTPDGGLYIFGRFNQPTGTALRLRRDGTIDPAFHVATSDEVDSGVVQPDGKLIFSHSNTIERVNADGTTDATWKRTGALNVEMTILPDGKLLAGGSRFFTGIGPVVAPPEVGFTHTADGLRLAWPAGFRLQRATQLLRPDWQDLAAPSPFTVPTGGPGEFYRVVTAP